jgi:hypothetical protein
MRRGARHAKYVHRLYTTRQIASFRGGAAVAPRAMDLIYMCMHIYIVHDILYIVIHVLHVQICICMYTYNICIYVHTHIHTHTHTHTHTGR